MATTADQAWAALKGQSREIANSNPRLAFNLGFRAGWKAQENRPFHCTFCGVEIIGATDAETILKAQDHTRACDVHPLAIENRRMRDALENYGAHINVGCFDLDNPDRCACGLDEAKA